MIKVTIERPDAGIDAAWRALAPFAHNAFIHPVALRVAHEALGAAIHVLVAWDEREGVRHPVGLWAVQGTRLLLWPMLEAMPFNYAFLSTPVLHPDHADEVMPAFFEAITHTRALPKTMWIMDIDAEGPAYGALQRALAGRPNVSVKTSSRPVAGRDFGLKRSGSTRKKLRQDWKRLAAAGELEMVNHRDGIEARAALEDFLALELGSWKGERGTALASVPRDAAFARRLIGELADCGAASVALLRLDGRPIAAQVLLYANGTAYTWKTAYDPAFARHSPGALLVDRISTELIDGGTVEAIDSCALETGFMGQLWAGRKQVADLVVSTAPGLSPAFVAAAVYYSVKEQLRQWRNRLRAGGPKPARSAPPVVRASEAQMIAAFNVPDEERREASAPPSTAGRAA